MSMTKDRVSAEKDVMDMTVEEMDEEWERSYHTDPLRNPEWVDRELQRLMKINESKFFRVFWQVSSMGEITKSQAKTGIDLVDQIDDVSEQDLEIILKSFKD